MDLFLSTRHVVPSIGHSVNQFPSIPFHFTTSFHLQSRLPRLLASSKKSSFQDFQDLAKPKRLLSTKELLQGPPDKIIPKLESDESNSLYKVLLCTSSIYGSDLSDQNAGILLCLIDEHGDSILERIPAIISQHHTQQSEDAVASDVILFQRGSTDEFMFRGPKLERIQALWIGLDSGTWRLGGASLTIISTNSQQREKQSENGSMYCSFTYNFGAEDVMLGEGSDLAMVELRPSLITEDYGADIVPTINENSAEAVSDAGKGITNEESMKEYADLKFSLLLYDTILIFTGTSITSITAGKDTASAFLIGGVAGFMYLLLLQRSVDTLPAPESIEVNKGNNFDSLFGGGKGPMLVFASAFAVAILTAGYNKTNVIGALTPREILAGMVGFLACKISVILAAFKPVSMGMKDYD